MEREADRVFHGLKEDILTYVELKFRLLKLIATERIARVVAILSHSIILVLLISFTILFLFISLGFYLGELLGSVALGFLIVSGLSFLLTIAACLGKKRIQVKIINILITTIQAGDDDEEDKNAESAGEAHPGKKGSEKTQQDSGKTSD